MMRYTRWVVGFLVLTATAALAAPAMKVDFGDWDHALWRPVREARFPAIVPFLQGKGFIQNSIPVGADEKDIVAAKDGIGVAIMLLRDFTATDVSLRCTMAYERKGAPSAIFRVQRKDDVIESMYSLVLYVDGLNLWKLSGGKWSKVGASKFEVTPTAFHDVRILAHGRVFTTYLDGQKKLVCADSEPLSAGEVGVWSGEGPCSFRKFFARPLAIGR